ncbi:MAG: putative hydrolase of the superfamily [Actinomycetota bacterium]|jgi:HAD superfamily hydrolase (TIGR01509 family)
MPAVVFDLGNVLVPWVPHRVISAACIEETEFFRWNADLDGGAPFAETVAAVRAAFPQWGDELDAFRDRWPETLGDPAPDVVAIVEELRAAGVGLYVLSNSSAETVPRSAPVSELLTRFDGVMLSGEFGVLKPDPAIFHEAEGRFGLNPLETWFVDDSAANVEGARAVGWNAHHFVDAPSLRAALSAAGVL